jgi:hypothetical protein
MNALTIGRWQTRYTSRVPIDPATRAAWDGCLDQLDLPAGVDDDAMVFIRRLRLATRLRHDGSAAQAASLWRDALLAALARESMAGDGGNIVRYRCRRDALCDMLYRACCRDASRDWVWIQMALLAPGVHAADAVALRAILALQQEPHAIWPALARLVLAEARTGALTALLYRAPPPALAALLQACPQSAPWRDAGTVPTSPAVRAVDAAIDVTLPLVAALLTWCARHAALAATRRDVVIVLLAAAAYPAPAASTSTSATAAPGMVAAVLAACTRLLAGVDAHRPLVATPRLPSGPRAPASAGQTDAAPVPPPSPAGADLAPAPAQPPALPAPCLDDVVEPAPTDWAGLPFLLHLLPAAGLLEQVAALAARQPMPPDGLFRVLWHLATSILGVPAADAAVRALCGGWQPAAADLDAAGKLPMPGALALPGELVAHQLRQALAQRLPGVPLLALCARPGMVHFEPGWIEVHMPLQRADARVRRAGLDLDPGWLPWLGCVVRFVYE